ncbi:MULTISPECIES: acyl-CoA dehydrogenase [Caballeronia]|jgi:acyl-CoA dehydrogenase|uniref:Medium-chain specific acyl-CoA dehydrogenase, mitochondrial n=1 Tax=Caballeronia zhejiangensis TaxID=871203 RepID=A0A656QJF6_9BURK|nr:MULTISPECIES: acyl-CoA dehydrogenase [Caballeronia]EKS67070.1 acyl-CoA dehydrogenase domain-containing protein [Burkholderia sp. SJ98]KDR30382.1 acyl-CoA dehydrogenase [Caballeronia zhejiangensis]MCG7404306.1 acyl-CoA dehydrogenase [Caballeronia zhejiangensis]MCI1045846.1 acyl-CoA dehydrogenase [Caballeronia zhejiangensis]MDR5789648.1 acyl-CoA dehydrogenase [Caballeronia sp. LP003]
MDFTLSDTQKMMIETARRFVRSELQPLEQQVEEEGALAPEIARDLQARARALGLYAVNMPAELGGGGLNTVDSMLCEEQFGHSSDILVRRAFGNVYDALLACEGEQIDRWLKPAIAGARTCGLAITETGAGSDAQGIETTARKTSFGWALNGSKHFISDAQWSDFFLVSARTGEKEISLFAVDKNLPGFTVGRDQRMMGLRGTPHHELFFDDVPLEPMALIGRQGEGFKLAMNMLGRVRLALIGARGIGKATHVLEMMIEYAGERRQFGTRIGDFQMIQQLIADSVMEINAARLMLLNTASMMDAGQDARDWISMVKVQASETLGRVVDRAVQVFGGMGFCKELAIERYYRDARVYRIFDGTSEIHRGIIARNAMKRGAALFDLHR